MNTRAYVFGAFLAWMLIGGAQNASAQPLTKDEIYEAQQILYDWVYLQGVEPDGFIGQRTKEAVSRFETWEKLPVAGELTRPIYELLKKRGSPKGLTWAAIAASSGGGYAEVKGYDTRTAVAAAARAACRAKDPKCNFVITMMHGEGNPEEGGIVVIRCQVPPGMAAPNGATTRLLADNDRTLKLATAKVFARVKTDGYDASTCVVIGSITAK